MPERWSDYLTIFMSALAVGYMIYEIDRRQRRLREVFDVLDAEDSAATGTLEGMVASGVLQPYTGLTLA
jgi:hypothetical protein